MARHRDIRRMDLDDERDDFNDYGQSVEEDGCMSPSVAEFMWPGGRGVSDYFSVPRRPNAMPAVPEVPETTNAEGPSQLPDIGGLSVAPKPRPSRVAQLAAEGGGQQPQVVVKSAGGKTTSGFSVTDNGRCQMTPSASSGNLRVATSGASAVGARPASPSPSMKVSRSARDVSSLNAAQPATPRLQSRPEGNKHLLNLVVIGHVDAGKSTLMGHLLYRLDLVNQKTMHKYKQESQKLGKASFAYAWVLDEGTEERSRGVTMDIARTHFQTKRFDVVLLDAPGHKDFIPNMISGAAQADAALLVVNATRGEFETGFDFGGQTREHTMLIRSLGVTQLAVAVNKLDTVDWSKQRFDDIQGQLAPFLKQTGFVDCGFVPCCGVTGENLTELPPESHPLRTWYKGPSLLEMIDKFKPPDRSVDRPLRMCVSDVYKGMTAGFFIAGKVETGAVQTGDKVTVMPSCEGAAVKSIQNYEGADINAAYAGDQCVLSLVGVDPANINVGDVICHPESVTPTTTRFEARVVFFNLARPITKGSQVIVHCNCSQRSASISKLISQINRNTGEVIKNKPRCLSKNTSGVVEISCDKPICIETYADCRELGRVTLRSEGVTLGAGIVTKVACDFTL